MGLILNLKPGDDFYVGHEQFELVKSLGVRGCTIQRKGDETLFPIAIPQQVEIAPKVLASIQGRSRPRLMRISIDADRSILVLHGNLYRNSPQLKS